MVMLRVVSDDDRPGPPTGPYPYECVACFVDRMTRLHGCTNQLTWATRWRDRCAPRATALERRLQANGGFCDCEVLMNVYARPEWLREEWDDAEESDVEAPAADAPDAPPPPCFGVRKGSTQACAHWTSPY